MKLISPLTKKLLEYLPVNAGWSIPFGSMRGVHWYFRAGNPGQILGRYELEIEQQFVQLLSKCEVFWDVGANVGWFSLLAANQSSEIQTVAFEPDENNIRFLKSHISQNGFNQIKVVTKALSESVGTAKFNPNAQFACLSDDGEVIVSTTTADHFIDEGGLVPDFIKVDIEGAETDFLKGADKLLKNERPILLMSAHGYKKRDECADILLEHNYQLDYLVSDSNRGDYVFIASPN